MLNRLAAMALTASLTLAANSLATAFPAFAADIRDRDGNRIGTVEENRIRPGRQLDVFDRDGKRAGTIERNTIRPDRQLDVLDKSGRRIGTIERKGRR